MLSAGATEIHHAYHVIGHRGEAVRRDGEVVVTGPYRRPEILPD